MVWEIIRSILFVCIAIFSFIASGEYTDGYDPDVIIPPAVKENSIHDFQSYMCNEAWSFEVKLIRIIQTEMNFKRTVFQLFGLTMLGCALPTYLVKKKKED